MKKTGDVLDRDDSCFRAFLKALVPGRAYRVVHAVGGPGVCRARRIFKWHEKRFGDIPCCVFTSRANPDVRGEWNPLKKSLTLTGRRLPTSEISIPFYDLESVDEITS